jgi:hypothetical protein
MTIGQIANMYNNFWGQIIRVFKGDEITVCSYAHELPNKMELGEYQALMKTEIKSFEANGVVIHFYI